MRLSFTTRLEIGTEGHPSRCCASPRYRDHHFGSRRDGQRDACLRIQGQGVGWAPARSAGGRQRGANPGGEVLAFGVAVVTQARPEEAAQAVLAAARDDVDMEVRDALR